MARQASVGLSWCDSLFVVPATVRKSHLSLAGGQACITLNRG